MDHPETDQRIMIDQQIDQQIMYLQVVVLELVDFFLISSFFYWVF
jgi:hypothetical protein